MNFLAFDVLSICLNCVGQKQQLWITSGFLSTSVQNVGTHNRTNEDTTDCKLSICQQCDDFSMKRILTVMASKHGIIISIGYLMRFLGILVFLFSEEYRAIRICPGKII